MNQKTKKMITVSMLIAIQVVAGRFFSISLPIVKIGFAFLPLSVIAILYGPIWSVAAAAIADILVALMGSFGYFPPMTISAILTGLIYGVSFYRKNLSLKRVCITVICENLFISIILQTFWLTLLNGKGYFALLPTRLLQNVINCPTQIICIKFVAYRIAGLMDHSLLRQGGKCE